MSELGIIVLGLAGVILLVAMNALFVAAEFAYVGVRRTRIEQLAAQGHGRARLLLGSLRELDSYIATTQLGITLASLGLGWVGEPLLARLVEPPVQALVGPWATETVSRTISVAFAFLLVTSLLIIFGELAPKTLALSQTESVALAVVWPVKLFRAVFRPFIWAMNKSGLLVVRALGVPARPERDSELDPEELELIIEASARAGFLSSSELLLARRALQFGAVQADQIMVPRTEMVAVPHDASFDELLALIEAHPHGRYPVFEEDLDHIVGVVEVKAVLALLRRGATEWRSAVRPVAAIPESVSVELAVAEMRARGTQVLVVVDEHGGTSGIVTADEVLHRLLGRWLGSPQQEREAIRPLSTGNLLLSGMALVGDVEDATGTELSDEDYDTIGGFMMARLGRIPKVGDRIDLPGYEFRVTVMDGRRVDRVLVIKKSLAE